MDTLRIIFIVAAAIVVAVVALKILSIVTSILISLLVTVAIFAAAAFLVYWLVRSVLPHRGAPRA
ncbi:MAG: hypothetical protein JOZ41_01165 [Chloroflexi bacterium]|nr:hypothetical protein [Chloroflexota bacterium]